MKPPIASHLSAASLALLAASNPSNAPLQRVARRRFRHLMAAPALQLLAGRSLREVARDSGISHDVLSRYLRGHSDITLQRVATLARVLGVSVGDLADYLLKVQANPLPSVR